MQYRFALSIYRHAGGQRSAHRVCVLSGCLLLLGLACVPHAAWARCAYDGNNHTAGIVTFYAGTVNLTLNQPPSTTTPIYTSNTNAVPPGTPLVLDCTGNTNSGIVNDIAGPPTGNDNTLYPTGIPGISYRILHPDTSAEIASYPNENVGYYFGKTTVTFSVASNLALYYVGPYLPSNGRTINGQVSHWNVNICNGTYNNCGGSTPQPVEIFNLNATIHIIVPTCDIAAGSVNKTVTLPGVSKSQFSGQGSTAGKTPFSLQLTNCSNSLTVFVSLNTNNPQTGASGVIAPTTGAGYATGVGVQILKANGTTPVTFGTVINTGTTSSANYAINLYARYYQTGASVGAGNVKAVATYTVQYQ
ncbi:MAG: fimbrial protein [Gammaproteobacteria bacterium]